MMTKADIAKALVVDVIDTTGKIRENVAHLRDLGERARVGAKLAVQATKTSLERMLERVADGLVDADERWTRTHTRGRR
jgi:hypothetical protein